MRSLATSFAGQNFSAQALEGVFRRYPGIHLALVFGSFAREQAREDSDLDVAVLARNTDLLELAAELSQATQREVDATSLEHVGVPLLEELIRDARPIYQRIPGAYAQWRSGVLLDLEIDRPWYQRMQNAWLSRVARYGLSPTATTPTNAQETAPSGESTDPKRGQ